MTSSARHRTAALACTLALAACGSQPSGEAAGGDDPAVPESSSTPAAATPAATPTPATSIPDDFPLSAGMGGPGDTIPTSRSGTGLRDLDLCGTSPLRGLGTRDRMVADNSGGEATNTRELVVLGSTEQAVELAQSLSVLAARCLETDLFDGWSLTTESRPSPFGDAPTAVLLQRYFKDGEPMRGVRVVHVVQAGAAVLVTWTYGEWEDVDDGLDQTVEPLRQTVAALALFDEAIDPAAIDHEAIEPSPEPTEPTESASPRAVTEIPDDFPMLAGWPPSSVAEGGDGRRGPTRTGDALEISACDQPWDEPAHADRLRSDWVNAEDYRTRQLTTYADEAGAVDAVESLVTNQRSCPVEEAGEDGFGTTREVIPVALGDGAWAILERDTFNGSPSIFGASTLVVRVGRAVLVVRHGGHAGYPSGDGQQQVEAMGSQAARSIDQMCQFTKTGC